jgi:hypothetical protein
MVQQDPIGMMPWTFLYHYLGLYPRISVAWELIPLSFVVDMVIDIGSFIRQFEGAPITVAFKTISSGYSVKDTDSHTDQQLWTFPNLSVADRASITGGAQVPGATGSYRRTQYLRIPSNINWDASALTPVQIGVPSFGQLGTILELLLSAFGEQRR